MGSQQYLASIFGLTGRVALVTGGSTGIGRAMGVALGRAGAKVILIARRKKQLEETVQHIRGFGVVAFGLALDVRESKMIKETVLAAHGLPDILVNAAGINPRPHLSDLTPEQWDEILAVNLTAPFQLGQLFGPDMARRGSGRIINIVSQQAFRVYGNSGGYGASKGGLVALTRSQAEAWSRNGVLCNAIAPGVVDTPMNAAVFSSSSKTKHHAERTLIGRNGVPGDFAGAAIYLASTASEAITGQVLFVDGGYSST